VAFSLDWRQACGAWAAAGLTAVGLALAIGAATGRSTLVPARRGGSPEWLRGPLDFGLSLHPWVFVALLILMCAFYLSLLWWSDYIPVRPALASIVALHLIFFLAPPLLSTDVFNYVDYARLGVLHGLNPYQHSPAAAPHDAAYAFIGWRTSTTVYGPLFTLVSYPLGALSLSAALWTAKLIAAAASLGSVALVWASARRLGRAPLPAAMFLGLNPVLLVYAVGGAHNDVLMMLLVLSGLYLVLAGREIQGALAVVGAGAVKVSSGLLLPFMLIGAKRPFHSMLAAIAGAATLGALAFGAFGSHAVSFVHVLSAQQQHGSLHSVPKALSEVLGLDSVVVPLHLLAMAGFAFAFILLLVHSWRGGDWLTSAGWATVALLVTTSWLLPWYVIWVLPLAALSASPRLRLAALGLGAFVIALRIPLWLG
jgi:alpha-1,6-mannosyltransferase